MFRKEVELLKRIKPNLSSLEERLERDRNWKDSEPSEQERALALPLSLALLYDLPFGLIHLVDSALELRQRRSLISMGRSTILLTFIIHVAGDRGGLVRENHQFGYHFHYLHGHNTLERSDVLLTFNPQEPISHPDTLYWEKHSDGLVTRPTTWSLKRKVAVHTAAIPSINKPGKQYFLQPGKGALQLYPAV